MMKEVVDFIDKWLREQNRHVISFCFERTQSATITTDTLWRIVVLGFARLYPSVCQHILNIVQSNKIPDPSDNDGRFKFLIETPLSKLNDVPYEELPVIVIDALDESGGLRYDSSRKDDHKGLLRMLKHWIHVDHLKRFELILTSRHDEFIQRMFPESMSIHIDIPSGSNVNPGDSTSHDIRSSSHNSIQWEKEVHGSKGLSIAWSLMLQVFLSGQ